MKNYQYANQQSLRCTLCLSSRTVSDATRELCTHMVTLAIAVAANSRLLDLPIMENVQIRANILMQDRVAPNGACNCGKASALPLDMPVILWWRLDWLVKAVCLSHRFEAKGRWFAVWKWNAMLKRELAPQGVFGQHSWPKLFRYKYSLVYDRLTGQVEISISVEYKL